MKIKISISIIVGVALGVFATLELSKEKRSVVVKEMVSHDSLYVAKVLQYGDMSGFQLTIEKEHTLLIVVQDTIALNNGYHSPMIKMKWTDNNDTLYVQVDYDFGENNLLFAFIPKSLLWKQLN